MTEIKIRTAPRKRPAVAAAGSLLLLILLVMPAAAMAAENFFPPRDETAGQVLPGSCSGNCCPPTTNVCLDDWQLQTTSDWIISDGTNYTEYIQISISNCTAGCSHTLGNCRPDNFTQGIILLAFIAFTAALIYFSPMFGPLGYLIQAVIIIAGLALATFMDVFVQSRWFFVAYTFGVAVFIMWRNFFQKDEESESGDDSA